jgi:predicted metal-binding membrane protein
MVAGTASAAQKRDRRVIIAGLVFLTGLSWAYLFYLAADMGGMGMAAMPQVASWDAADVFLTFLMWAVMMVAMMTPSASPMILMFARLAGQRRESERSVVSTNLFWLGYLLVWTGFSALAALFQWLLHEAALISPMMVTTSPFLGAAILLAAGIFQLTPLKNLCLAHCRTPMGFLITEWREGKAGAVKMGINHGRFCLGCCWSLMALLFVAGVMNLLWVSIIAAFVLIEKIAPQGEWVGRVAGILLVGWGTWILAGAL